MRNMIFVLLVLITSLNIRSMEKDSKEAKPLEDMIAQLQASKIQLSIS